MNLSLKPVSQQVMVITGASSGIGLATAKAAAAQGARLVLASRNGTALEQITEELKSKGAQAIYVVTDVSKRDEVDRLAQTALDHFGTFDTWVNNAGQGLWGKLDEVSDEDHRQLFDINFWGIVYGSTTALKTLKKRGGALINLGSIVSDVSFPIQGMYGTTKHAIKGFTDALRRELIDEDAPVSVTLIQPAAIATPFAEHAKNYTGKQPALPPPLYKPESVADAILLAAGSPRRSLHIGGAGKVFTWVEEYLPALFDLTSSLAIKSQVKDQPNQQQGALWQPGQDGEVNGYQGKGRTSTYTAAYTHPVTAGLIAAAVGVGIGLALWNRSR